MPPATKPRRIRRAPDEARREILDAAEALLSGQPFRALSVDDLMGRTGMTRSSFYHYFRSLDDVAIALMRRGQGGVMEAAAPRACPRHEGGPAPPAPAGVRPAAAGFSRHRTAVAPVPAGSLP